MTTPAQRALAQLTHAMLVGRTIVRVGYLPAAEAQELGWSDRPAVLHLDDGTVLYATYDEEGNGAGVLMAEGRRGELCLGRLPA